MKKYKTGYITGIFDLFNIGHLSVLKKAKYYCDYLIAGVSSDELVQLYKHKIPIISFEERKTIVEAMRYVDKVIIQENSNEIIALETISVDIMFIDDDWKDSLYFNKVENICKSRSIDLIYLSQTEDTVFFENEKQLKTINKGEIRVFVIGVFDLIHKGHIELLRRAKLLGTTLIVGVNSDAKVSSYKRQPYISETERLAIVQNIKYVDVAFIMNETVQTENILKYNIQILVHGDDWTKDKYMNHIGITSEFMNKNNFEIKILPHTEGMSTSEIIKRIENQI
jgi:glycerol-3-phosphate cytidylyltransferase